MAVIRLCDYLDGLVQVHVAGIGEHDEMQAPQDRSETWLVDARRDGLLSIMTPVYPDNETMALLHNQVGRNGESRKAATAGKPARHMESFARGQQLA